MICKLIYFFNDNIFVETKKKQIINEEIHIGEFFVFEE